MHVLGRPDLFIEVPGLPPSPNRLGGKGWPAFYHARSDYKKTAGQALYGLIPAAPYERVLLHIEFCYPRQKTCNRMHSPRDLDNDIGSAKALIDTLTEHGVLVDDTSEHLAYLWASQGIASARCVRLRLYALAPGTVVVPAIA